MTRAVPFSLGKGTPEPHSWPHAGAYGEDSVRTPAFDRVARQGVLFTHAFCPASQCGPSRASLLTGRNIWQLEEAGTQASLFPAKFAVYPELLEQVGYHIGYTGKPWAPGNWRDAGRKRNPAGKAYDEHQLEPPTSEISFCDYAANFAEFLQSRPPDAPFCFWFGCHEPHRNFEDGSGVRAGKSPEDVTFPPFYPDNEVVRSDLVDYRLEIEWFDEQLGKMLRQLERRNELENTLVVITSDNGMPFPRAKATLYEAGTRVPLAVQWPARIPAGRVVKDLVSFVDLAPTFLNAAGLSRPPEMVGRSLLDILASDASGWVDSSRDYVVLGKERHNHARADNLGYPTRAIRTKKHLYIRNLKPERWPMGDPPGYYCHTKMINPTKAFILANQHHRDPELEVQVFQFARYLLIASSRPGTQPAVLHGIWPNWRLASKGANNAYHLNINIAENYWPAEVTGLGEVHEPVVDLLEHYLPNAGTYARGGYDCGGVVCGHNIDAWLAPSRRGATRAAAQSAGGFGWLSQHVWEHYAFSGDQEFLRRRGMPILMTAAEFFLDYSRYDADSGKIYIGPSGSRWRRGKCTLE